MKHTPTPWTWIEGDPDIFTHWNNKEVVLATVKPPVWREDRLSGIMAASANAAHIVKCVNLHDELVEALEHIHKLITKGCEHGFSDHDWMEELYSSQGKRYEALKKAGAL